MISRQDLERLIGRGDGDGPILSLFLDMSVNSDNKRTHGVFLNQKEAQLQELNPSLSEEISAAFVRVRGWLAEGYDEQNRGVVVYTQLTGVWFEALQFPVPIPGRAVISARPMIVPLAQVLESYHHHGVVLLDRAHVRILSVYLGTLLDEIEVRPKPLVDAPHDIQAGGYSQARYQRHKVEETRQFFREFAREVEEFMERFHPGDLVILGTEENVAKFREFLPEQVLARVVHTGAAQVDDNAAEILLRIAPHLEAHEALERSEMVGRVRDRVLHDYLATAGFQGTLAALQEGKVDTLVIARDHTREGARCTRCGFVFAEGVTTCPYDGAEILTEVDVVEEIVRMAEGQGVAIAFAEPADVEELNGVGALLRF